MFEFPGEITHYSQGWSRVCDGHSGDICPVSHCRATLSSPGSLRLAREQSLSHGQKVWGLPVQFNKDGSLATRLCISFIACILFFDYIIPDARNWPRDQSDLYDWLVFKLICSLQKRFLHSGLESHYSSFWTISSMLLSREASTGYKWNSSHEE